MMTMPTSATPKHMQYDDDADKRHAETHADANQLDHVHGPNRFEPRARRHIDQADGAERHANEYGCSWSLHGPSRVSHRQISPCESAWFSHCWRSRGVGSGTRRCASANFGTGRDTSTVPWWGSRHQRV